MNMMLSAPELMTAPRTERDRLWERCRNGLGIARLLVQEGRPAPLVDTACHTAAEAACRTALEQAGVPFDGDVERALDYLSAPSGLWRVGEGSPLDRLAAAEKLVGWVAGYLRAEAPERSWGF
jgi:hypothetical protein